MLITMQCGRFKGFLVGEGRTRMTRLYFLMTPFSYQDLVETSYKVLRLFWSQSIDLFCRGFSTP